MKITPIGHLHFTVTSASRPGVLHLVDLQRQADAGQDSRRAWCSCEFYNFNPGQYCRHIKSVVEYLQDLQAKAKTDEDHPAKRRPSTPPRKRPASAVRRPGRASDRAGRGAAPVAEKVVWVPREQVRKLPSR